MVFPKRLMDCEIYFHSNSVLQPGFGDLDVGAEVYFAEERGEKGPQSKYRAICREVGEQDV